jgi:hypothetical protein
MSQVSKQGGGTPIPPVATTYVTDVSTPAVPAANILNVYGGSSSDDDINGIWTDGSSGSNTLTIELTNRISGTAQTIGATSATVFSFVLPVDGNYAFDVNLSAWDTIGKTGAAFKVFAGIKRVAGVASLLNPQDGFVNQEASMVGCQAGLSAVAGTMNLDVTGLAGKTINWVAVGTYTFVGN